MGYKTIVSMVFIIWLLLIAAWVTSGFSASNRTYGDVEAIVLKVQDGDTLKVRISSWPTIIGDGIGVRVYGVDCRELKSGATAAKDVVEKWIPVGAKVWLFGLRRDKYFRILASVGYNCIEEDLGAVTCEDLAENLLDKKLAVPYFGEKKTEIPQSIK